MFYLDGPFDRDCAFTGYHTYMRHGESAHLSPLHLSPLCGGNVSHDAHFQLPEYVRAKDRIMLFVTDRLFVYYVHSVPGIFSYNPTGVIYELP